MARPHVTFGFDCVSLARYKLRITEKKVHGKTSAVVSDEEPANLSPTCSLFLQIHNLYGLGPDFGLGSCGLQIFYSPDTARSSPKSQHINPENFKIMVHAEA